jgi:hypothetical protein
METHESVLVPAFCALSGVVIYIASAYLNRITIRLYSIVESSAFAAIIGSGLQLSYGALFPSTLVHVLDAHGNLAELPAGASLHLTTLASLHIFVGGMAISMIAGISFMRYCAPSDSQRILPMWSHSLVLTGISVGAIGLLSSIFGMVAAAAGTIAIPWTFWAVIFCLSLGTLAIAIQKLFWEMARANDIRK